PQVPSDKQSFGLDAHPRPVVPVALPTFPPAPVWAPMGAKPTAALAEPGPLACVGAFFGFASSALERGRARIAKGEYDDAAKVLEQAAKSGEEKDLVLEARFWLGETYWRLGRVEAADRLFRQVVETAPKGSTYALWAT